MALPFPDVEVVLRDCEDGQPLLLLERVSVPGLLAKKLSSSAYCTESVTQVNWRNCAHA